MVTCFPFLFAGILGGACGFDKGLIKVLADAIHGANFQKPHGRKSLLMLCESLAS
jgi:hypothetical protein